MRPHCFILIEACPCRLELAYFAGKISKNGLVCKNAVTLANYGSCRLLVMDPCFCPMVDLPVGMFNNESSLNDLNRKLALEVK